MPEFRKFLKFNNIDDDTIRYAANYMDHTKIVKGTYIFKQGDVADKFYAIINGKVSIRRVRKVITDKCINNK